MRRLPTLVVESACQEDWSAMKQGAEGRHCGRCDKTVIDLSRVTRAQAVALMREHGGTMCGRVRANTRGETVFAAEPVKRGLVPIALAGLLAACASEPVEPAAQAPIAVDGDGDGEVGLAMPTSGTFGGSLATGVMMPIGPDAPLVATPCVASVDTPEQQEEGIEPTDEQRALTRRKHQRQRPSYPPPITHHLMGVMAMPD